MKKLLIAAVVLRSLALAQNGFAPILDRPADVIQDSATLSATGVWLPVDRTDKKSQLSGPSVSEITCYRARNTCTELQANMTVFPDGSFTLSPDSMTYQVSRWNDKELVAQTIGGICRVMMTLKFDFVNKKVYARNSLSEPVNDLSKTSQEMCLAADGMFLELHGGSTFGPAPKKNGN